MMNSGAAISRPTGAREVDFFSIGRTIFIQYAIAVTGTSA